MRSDVKKPRVYSRDNPDLRASTTALTASRLLNFSICSAVGSAGGLISNTVRPGSSFCMASKPWKVSNSFDAFV